MVMDMQVPSIIFKIDTDIRVTGFQHRLKIRSHGTCDRDRRRSKATARIGQSIGKAVAAIEGRGRLIRE